MVWFSRAYGEFGDNLDIIAANAVELAPDWIESYPAAGPVARFIGDLFPVREYVLNDAIAGWVGLVYVTERYSREEREYEYERRDKEPSAFPKGVLEFLSCHDECFCNATPLADITVRRIITQVLRMHSFYHQKDYDWSRVVDEITSLLKSYKALRLRSHPAGRSHKAVTNVGIPSVGWSIDKGREKNRTPRFKLAGSVIFDDDVARLHLSKIAP
jgi:hypothetical protein